ncbi:MAG TPA: carbohydrate ABC transporter permease [Oceanobacillus sp.]|nr:carbohydrate ABC transporter permease [Oceanobacillus sp.]
MAATAIPAKTTVVQHTSPVLSQYVRKFLVKASFTLFASILLLVFLSPFGYMVATGLKNQQQISNGFLLPMSPIEYEYNGARYPLYNVPDNETGAIHQWALVTRGREESTFIDPANPEAGEIVWQGRWRTLDPVIRFDPQWGNFIEVWQGLNFPRVFLNTLVVAVFGMIGTLVSSIAVAYGFARFPIPGKNILFMILISTIVLPTFVTLVPTYTFFARIGWTGTWLPLIVPHFFANAYNVFLLRQFFMKIPREQDEAAMVDGATPLQILVRVIVPQALPVIIAVSINHFVFAWNDYFNPLIYLLGSPELWPISVAVQQYNYAFGTKPYLVQATSLLALALPVVIFFFAQKAYMRGVVITGVDK